MTADPHVPQEATDGRAIEAVLWSAVTRLRARGWRISLWEIQRAQDVIVYLVARLGRLPTDDELHRHLRPVLCGRENELAPFSEIFRGSTAAESTTEVKAPRRGRGRRAWSLGLAGLAALAVCAFGVWLLPVRSHLPHDGGGGLRRLLLLWTTW